MAPTARTLLLALAAAALTLLAPGAGAVWLHLPPSGTKCVSEEIQPNVVVVADYEMMFETHATDHPTVAVKVTPLVPSPLFHRVRNFSASCLAFIWRVLGSRRRSESERSG
jgi:p24 family protein delta-1